MLVFVPVKTFFLWLAFFILEGKVYGTEKLQLRTFMMDTIL